MKASVWDTTVKGVIYSFKIGAEALGGAHLWTATRTLEYKCFNNYLLFKPADFNDKVFTTVRTASNPKKYEWSLFTSSHYLCDVTSY
jgi:hypothetical protein